MSRLFDTAIGITGERGDDPRLSLSLMACVMDGSFDESFSDQATSSTRQRVTVIVRVKDLCGFVPRACNKDGDGGDVVATAEGRKFKVWKVEPFYSREYVLDCRGIS